MRYRNRIVKFPDGTSHSFLAGEEKGIDVRMALDIISMAHRREYDVALVFSQDQDLSEAAQEIRAIAREPAGLFNERAWTAVLEEQKQRIPGPAGILRS